MKYTIHVTQGDINEGKAFHVRMSPVALAVRRTTHREISINRNRAYDFLEDKSISLPQIVKDFTLAFDGGKAVQPFDFELEI